MERIEWNEYFMRMADLTKERSSCVKRKVGCVLVKDNRIISTGYNGTPTGLPNCNEGGCARCARRDKRGTNLDLCVCMHAEANALLYAGKDSNNGDLYCTLSPCLNCTKMIIQSGIKNVYYSDDYESETQKLSNQLFQLANINIQKFPLNSKYNTF